MKAIRTAVIGAGRLGKIHARIYASMPHVELYGVCDIDRQAADSCAQEFKTKSFYDYKRLLGLVDAVSVAAPTPVHFPIAAAFLKNNVHVLIEKPMTASLRQARILTVLAKKHNRILQIGHVERFNPAVQALKRLCRRPRFIECHRLSPYPRRSIDISVVLDLMIHDLDIILALVNTPLINCRAIGVNVLSPSEDIANARLSFRGGTVCNITASRVSGDTLRKIRIFQKNSYISLDYAQQKIMLYRKRGRQVTKREIAIDKKEPLAEELYSFIRCVRQNRPPLVCGEDAQRALKIAMQISRLIRNHAKHYYNRR